MQPGQIQEPGHWRHEYPGVPPSGCSCCRPSEYNPNHPSMRGGSKGLLPGQQPPRAQSPVPPYHVFEWVANAPESFSESAQTARTAVTIPPGGGPQGPRYVPNFRSARESSVAGDSMAGPGHMPYPGPAHAPQAVLTLAEEAGLQDGAICPACQCHIATQQRSTASGPSRGSQRLQRSGSQGQHPATERSGGRHAEASTVFSEATFAETSWDQGAEPQPSESVTEISVCVELLEECSAALEAVSLGSSARVPPELHRHVRHVYSQALRLVQPAGGPQPPTEAGVAALHSKPAHPAAIADDSHAGRDARAEHMPTPPRRSDAPQKALHGRGRDSRPGSDSSARGGESRRGDIAAGKEVLGARGLVDERRAGGEGARQGDLARLSARVAELGSRLEAVWGDSREGRPSSRAGPGQGPPGPGAAHPELEVGSTTVSHTGVSHSAESEQWYTVYTATPRVESYTARYEGALETARSTQYGTQRSTAPRSTAQRSTTQYGTVVSESGDSSYGAWEKPEARAAQRLWRTKMKYFAALAELGELEGAAPSQQTLNFGAGGEQGSPPLGREANDAVETDYRAAQAGGVEQGLPTAVVGGREKEPPAQDEFQLLQQYAARMSGLTPRQEGFADDGLVGLDGHVGPGRDRRAQAHVRGGKRSMGPGGERRLAAANLGSHGRLAHVGIGFPIIEDDEGTEASEDDELEGHVGRPGLSGAGQHMRDMHSMRDMHHSPRLDDGAFVNAAAGRAGGHVRGHGDAFDGFHQDVYGSHVGGHYAGHARGHPSQGGGRFEGHGGRRAAEDAGHVYCAHGCQSGGRHCASRGQG